MLCFAQCLLLHSSMVMHRAIDLYKNSDASIHCNGAAMLKAISRAKASTLSCRWNRAQQLGLNPPAEVHRILESLPDEDSMHMSIWAGRV